MSKFLYGVSLPTKPDATGGGGALPPYSGDGSSAVMENVPFGPAVFRRIYIEEILQALGLNLSSVTTTLYEIGDTSGQAQFTATYLRSGIDVTANLLTCTIEDNQGGPVVDLIAAASENAFFYSAPAGPGLTYIKGNDGSTLVASVTFTLKAEDAGSGLKTDTVTWNWRTRTYWGKSVIPGAVNEAFIQGLAHWQLDNNRNITFTTSGGDEPGPGEYIYYAFPSAWGSPTFTVGGFSGGFIQVGTSVPVLNGFGETRNYDVYRSVNDDLGVVTVVVT